MSKRSLGKRIGYNVLRVAARVAAVLLFRFRCEGRAHIPAAGGGLVCANHQSFFDPVLVGLVFDRRLNFLARKTLFDIGALRWLIVFLDAIPLDREGVSISALKESLKRLRRGELLLIFPEGTRSRDGEVAPLKPGFCALARRGKIPLIPAGVDGAHRAWPRTALLPRLTPVAVCIGEPITPEEFAALSDEQMIAELQSRILACHARARRMREAR